MASDGFVRQGKQHCVPAWQPQSGQTGVVHLFNEVNERYERNTYMWEKQQV